jgi:phage baseplate assembly protein gpV
MKKLIILVFALALALPAFAQNKPTANYSGVVEKYDAATKTLTIKKKDKQGDFVLTDTSEVLKDKTKADAAAISVGQKAEVEFWLEGSTKLVKKLKVSGGTAGTQ